MGLIKIPHVSFCFGVVVWPVLWLQQAQLFVKCAQQCSDTTFSPQLWAASSDNSVTCAAAPATEPSHTSHSLSEDTGNNTQTVSVATSACTPYSLYAPYVRLNRHVSVTVAVRRPSAHVNRCFASPLKHKVWHRCAVVIFYRHTQL